MSFKNIFNSNKKAVGFIVLVIFLVYGWTVFFDFVYLDEEELIIGNQNFISQPKNFFEVFKHDVNFPSGFSPYYRPIVTLSFMADAFIGGLNPFYYHFTNLLLHIAASVLVFYLFINLGYDSKISLFSSLIFSVHPALNQAVAWVPGRNDPLLMIFLLLSFLSFIKLMDRPKYLILAGHISLFTLAVFTKETAIALPLILISYTYLLKRKSWVFKYAIGSWAASMGIWYFLRQAILQTKDLVSQDILKIIFSSLPAMSFYIGKIIIHYGFSVLPTLKDSNIWFGLVSILILSAMLFRNGISRRIIFGLTWFILFLLPSLISYDYESRVVFLEHRLYIPIVGFLIVLMEIQWIKIFPWLKNKIRIVSVSVIVVLSLLSIVHLQYFKNRLNFWLSAVAGSPNLARAHNGLGTAYIVQNELDKAQAEYLKAIDLNSQEKKIHNNLGVVYSRKKLYQLAEEEFKKEIEINSSYETAYYNLGRLYAVNDKFKEAEFYWLKSLEIDPNYSQARQDLAVYYFQNRDYEKSIFQIEEMLKRGAVIHPELKKFYKAYSQQ